MLLKGEQLPVVMLLLGRLKAISAVVLQENSWTLAQTHEVTRTNATGILTSRDLRHAQRDLRDLQRLTAGGRGAHLAGRQLAGRGQTAPGQALRPEAERGSPTTASPAKGRGKASRRGRTRGGQWARGRGQAAPQGERTPPGGAPEAAAPGRPSDGPRAAPAAPAGPGPPEDGAGQRATERLQSPGAVRPPRMRPPRGSLVVRPPSPGGTRRVQFAPQSRSPSPRTPVRLRPREDSPHPEALRRGAALRPRGAPAPESRGDDGESCPAQ